MRLRTETDKMITNSHRAQLTGDLHGSIGMTAKLNMYLRARDAASTDTAAADLCHSPGADLSTQLTTKKRFKCRHFISAILLLFFVEWVFEIAEQMVDGAVLVIVIALGCSVVMRRSRRNTTNS